MNKTKKPKRWPVHVSVETYEALRKLAKARDMAVAELAESIVAAGVKRKASDSKRHATTKPTRSPSTNGQALAPDHVEAVEGDV